MLVSIGREDKTSVVLNVTHNLDGPVPRAGDEGVLGDGVPGRGKGFAVVLVEDHDGELAHANVEELERSVAAGHHELVLVDL